MGTTKTTRIYASTEFGDKPHVKILEREVGNLSISAQPNDIHRSGTDVLLIWDTVLPLATDFTLIDAVVAAHVGGATTKDIIYIESESESANSTDVWEDKVELKTSRLVAGSYEIVWYAEIACDAVVSNSFSAVRILIDGTLEFADKNSGVDWLPVSGNNFVNVLEGDSINTTIRYRKSGIGVNMAKIQKARISFRPIEITVR